MPWTHTADIPDDFEGALVAMCRDALSDGARRCNPLDLLACWNSESGVSPRAVNPHGYAAGLFQAMPDTLRNLGWQQGDERWDTSDGHASLAREFSFLSATEQLPYARAYYGAHRGSLTNAAACYVATFLPAYIDDANDPDYILCAKAGTVDFPGGKLAWAYDANHGAFDPGGKGWITVGDLSARIARVAAGPRWEEIRHRVIAAQSADLSTVLGVQCALSRLGYDPGPLDGIFGARTRAAVIAFAAARGLQDRSGAPDSPELRGELSGAMSTVG